MTAAQIAALQAMYPNTGGSTDPGQYVKYFTTSGGKTFRIQDSLGVPGSYSLYVDAVNELMVVTPLVTANGNTSFAIESIDFGEVETIAFLTT